MDIKQRNGNGNRKFCIVHGKENLIFSQEGNHTHQTPLLAIIDENAGIQDTSV